MSVELITFTDTAKILFIMGRGLLKPLVLSLDVITTIRHKKIASKHLKFS